MLAATLTLLIASQTSVPVVAANGIVSSAEPLATQVGVDIMKRGGNAFDAAAAVGLALAVTYPAAGNLGGGGFCVALTANGTSVSLDFRETAPSRATKDMFLDAKGDPDPDKSQRSYLSIGVPGTVDGLIQLHNRFGKIKWSEVVQPAIKLARAGFVVSDSLHRSLEATRSTFERYPASARQFLPNGRAPAFGGILKQPDLAMTLERVAKQGRAGFYGGEAARKMLADMQQHGGLLTQHDLDTYRAKWREPFTFQAAGCTWITHPLPSSGGITLAQILGLVDLETLKSCGWNSSSYVQRLVEAERLAYADRNHYLGDPDFVKVPVERLTSPEYLSERRKLIPTGRAGHSDLVGPGLHEHEETTHYTVADREGNVVAITYTLNGGFGVGAVAEGLGFLWNNEMDDFTSKPGFANQFGLVQGEANAIAPGKRMLSSMTPMILVRDGKFFMTVGSPGGSTIITTVLQVALNVILFDMNIRDAVDASRFHHQWLPDDVKYERYSLTADTQNALRTMGYRLVPSGTIGIACGILRRKDGMLTGWSDKRTDGLAAGY